MRTAFVAFGIILVFAGVIVASASAEAHENKQSFLVRESKIGGLWGISGRFEEGDKLIFFFSPNPLEEEEPLTNGEYKEINVEIVNPNGNKTVFKIVFSRVGSNLAPPEISVVLDEGGVAVSEPLGEVGGFVRLTGEYLANITTKYHGGPPRVLQLHAEILDREYPYLSVLPVGIILIVVGGSLSIWGAKSSKGRLQSRMKKR